MKISPECFPCILRQALDVAYFNNLDETKARRLMNEVMKILLLADENTSPPEIAKHIAGLTKEFTGKTDPYAEVKRDWTMKALRMEQRLLETVQRAEDEFDAALRISIAGNIIDLAQGKEIDVEKNLEKVLRSGIAGQGLEQLREEIRKAPWILYLGDNAGETVFDKVFIKTIGKRVVFAVKSGPVLNDATMEDAVSAGLQEVSEIVETGSASPGTVLKEGSSEFLELFHKAPLIIAKGQANFETLTGLRDRRIFFLFQVKCRVIGRLAGDLPVGSVVTMREE